MIKVQDKPNLLGFYFLNIYFYLNDFSNLLNLHVFILII